MADLNLELILESHPLYGEAQILDLPVAIHVHKRLEQFRYLNSINENGIPIACLRNLSVDVTRNLLIVNKAHSVLANSPRLFTGEARHDSVVATSYSSPYSAIVATNRTFTDSRGKNRPLFFRHALPEGTTEAIVTSKISGNKEMPGEGYLIDLDSQSVYTNHRNTFDFDSGTHKLFFVSGSTEDGATFNTLLNTEPVAKEASWEDLDPDTGDLVDTYPLYSRSKTGRGYTFYFNSGGKWYIRPYDKGLIQPRKPRAKRPNSPWFLRITNGDVSAVVNDSVRRYYIPEFNTQPFIPYNPIRYASKEELFFVNKRVLAATRQNLKIDPNSGLHLELRIEDAEGTLLRVYTTDQSLEGTRVSNLDVFYETDKIASWDNVRGFIQLAVDVLPAWVYTARYYYEADDYEYTLVNLNPITNKRLKDHIYVFYCVPDVNSEDRAIHHLVVNYDGTIVETSQSLGLGHPNLQLTHGDGSYNSSTVIGMQYFSEGGSSFLDLYGAGFANTNGYMILAEVCGIDPSFVEDQIEVDVRRHGGVIDPEFYEEAFTANPRMLQSHLGYGEAGQVIPQTNVVVLEPPLSLLEDYGGNLTQTQAEGLLRTQMPVSGYAVVKWVYPKSELTATSFVSDQVVISLTWEGLYTYKVYRRNTSGDSWSLVWSTVEPAEGAITWTDTNVESDHTYQYSVAIEDNGIEFPKNNTVVVFVR